MPVNTPRADYLDKLPKWQRCRDCYDGSDAVKARTTAYLPQLGDHATDPGAYEAYLARAVFYNATRRTVQGLGGAIFQKPLATTGAELVEGDLKDVSLRGESLEAFAQEAGREELISGNYGIRVDYADAERRPTWTLYRAEDVINWRTEVRDGVRHLVLVVLRESYEPTPAEIAARGGKADEFSAACEEQYRVLRLAAPQPGGAAAYQTEVWRKDAQADAWAIYETKIPTRGALPLDFIPFVFDPCLALPPLLDLADMNLSHYRNSADLEHGLHFVGVPQMVISGAEPERDEQCRPKRLRFGPTVPIVLPAGGDAKILQANGDMLGALSEERDDKLKRMATLGARLLEDTSAGGETATAFLGRHSGEQASLRAVARELSRDLTRALRIHIWWSDAGRLLDSPDKVDASVALNDEFVAAKATPDELRAWMELLQEGKISEATFYELLRRGNVAREGVTLEQERQDIATEAQARAEAEAERQNAQARKAMTAALKPEDEKDETGDGAAA